MAGENELPRLWDILTGGVGLGAILSTVASWGQQKQKLEDVMSRVSEAEAKLARVDERSRLVERIDERTKNMQTQHAVLESKMDEVLREMRSRFDRPRQGDTRG